MRKKLVLYLSAITVVILPIIAGPVQTQDQLLRILTQARSLVEQGRTADALKILNEASAAVVALETENLILKEEFLWETAMSNLDFSNQLTVQGQYIEYARMACECWKRYINWYSSLPSEQKARLGQRIRINMATAFLGNSIIRMGEPRRLFEEYAEISEPEFFGPDALALWKSWLYACPDMVPVPSAARTTELRRRKICDSECTEYWVIYADTLALWAQKANLSQLVRERKLREAEQIKQIAEECQH